jgi:hypothetical protein
MRKSAPRSAACEDRITWWQLDGRPIFDSVTEACIEGRILAAGACFGADRGWLVACFLGEQFEDGGWHCAAPPSTRSWFNRIVCALDGILAYEQAWAPTAALMQACPAHRYIFSHAACSGRWRPAR